MAKFPRSNRKMFQIQKVTTYKTNYFIIYIYDNSSKERYVVGGFLTKKEARQYVSRRRRAIKNRSWEVNKNE